MPFVDKLREEIIEAQRSEASFTKWKLLLVAGIGAASLGVLPNGHFSVRTLALTALLPLVCLYVDALCYHSGMRVMTIAKYLRLNTLDEGAIEHPSDFEAVRDYEKFCRNHRHRFGLEGIALCSVSVALSAGVVIDGIGICFRWTWVPDPFLASTPLADRLPLVIVLIASGLTGCIACASLYLSHRRKVRELDDSETRLR